MIFRNHIFPHHFHPEKNAINTLIVSSFFRIAGISMLALFSSIYIFTSAQELGFSYKNAIYTVLLFYSLLFSVKLIFLFLGQKYSLKRGFKHTIWLSAIPFTIFIPLMIMSEHYFWLIPISACFWGAYSGLFWWGYHGFFFKKQKAGHYGQTIGLTLFVYTAASVIMPIIGAIMIENIGYYSVYILAFILIVISLFVLGKSDDVAQKHDVTLESIYKQIMSKKALVATLATRGMSMESYATFWQLYLFLLFGTVLDLGIIASVSVLITSFLMIFIGKYVDKHGEKEAIFLSTPLLGLSWFFRFFITNIIAVIGVNALGSFSGRIMSVSVDEYTYKLANKTHTSPVLLLREVGLILGIFTSLAIVGLITHFGFELKVLFLVVAVVMLLPIILENKYAEKK